MASTRRGFLGGMVGLVVAAVTRVKVAQGMCPSPPVAPEVGDRFIVGEYINPDQVILDHMMRASAEAMDRLVIGI